MVTATMGSSFTPTLKFPPLCRRWLKSLHAFLRPLSAASRSMLNLLRFHLRTSVIATVVVTLFATVLCLLVVVPLLSSIQQPVAVRSTISTTMDFAMPTLQLPHPYGIAAPVMAAVLPAVKQFLQGGTATDEEMVDASIDVDHLHGALMGHYAHSRLPQWRPTPFDFTKETAAMKAAAHANASFNTIRAASLPLDRQLLDMRHPKCQSHWYANMTSPEHNHPSISSTLAWLTHTPHKTDLPSASVIIVFYNEPLATLLRTVHSVLNRSPKHLLHEVLLVDDASDPSSTPWLSTGAALERHLQLLPKTRLARLHNRGGLMRARNVGASLARAPVLVFLDAHVETTTGWLPPLLARMSDGERHGIDRVVVPAIDVIDADDFSYRKGGIEKLAHNWALQQTGAPREPGQTGMETGDEPVITPVMSGGLFAISRRFFDKLGFYDPGMQLWGGEEMELSFRVWMCGGTLECVPCSRVGHVFRSARFFSAPVYNVPANVIVENRLRASFWMGEFALLFRLAIPPATRSRVSLSFYEQVDARLKCRSFRWYLETVAPHMLPPAEVLVTDAAPPMPTYGAPAVRRRSTSFEEDDRRLNKLFRAHGFLRNLATMSCADHLHLKFEGAPFGVYPCHYQGGSQSVVMTPDGRILAGERLLDGCLTSEADLRLTQRACREGLRDHQTWEVLPTGALNESTAVTVAAGGRCLTIVQGDEQTRSPYSLRMMACGGSVAAFQRWEWQRFGNLTMEGPTVTAAQPQVHVVR